MAPQGPLRAAAASREICVIVGPTERTRYVECSATGEDSETPPLHFEFTLITVRATALTRSIAVSRTQRLRPTATPRPKPRLLLSTSGTAPRGLPWCGRALRAFLFAHIESKAPRNATHPEFLRPSPRQKSYLSGPLAPRTQKIDAIMPTYPLEQLTSDHEGCRGLSDTDGDGCLDASR